MEMYKIGDSDNYVSFNKNDLRRIYLLQQLENNNGVELDENEKPIRFKNNILQKVKINEEDLFSYLYLEQQDLEEEILYDNLKEEYLHSVRVNKSPYSVIRRVKDFDYFIEDEYLKEKIEEKVKENWKVVIEKLDDTIVMKYFNSDKFKKETLNSISVDNFVKSDPLFDVNKLDTIIKDFDFSKEEDKLKVVELLDKEIKENLNNVNVDINIKEIIKSNPDFFDLDRLIKAEEKIILKVFQEIELEKDGHTIKVEATKEQDITDKIIEELTKQTTIEDPYVDNKLLTEEEIRKRSSEGSINYEKEEKELIEKINFYNSLEL
ncbi:hypothetical protein [uncultured Tissierella sp.]|uniref:hypothetical protein n=1 Tax=uncultured Tissierella sp. TaxID=448160 RepID=UPI0028051A0E|nr:hypothetical protein [uncultured Tissierella sp.]MDU5082844.1 hypothetical protein [Bacillota bacterium]